MRRLGIAVAVVLLASCGGSDNSGANPSPETGTERTDVSADTDVTADTDATDVTDGAEAAAAPGTLLELLSLVPDTVAVRSSEITYSSWSRVRAGDTAASGEEDLQMVLGRSEYSIGAGYRYSDCLTEDDCVAELGFDSRSLDAVLRYGTLPDMVEVLWGSFDPAAIEAALRAAPGGEGVEVREEGDVTYLSLGEEGKVAVRERSAHRPLGEALRMAIGPSWMVVTRSAAALDEALAARAGGSLAASADGQAVAAHLDAARVQSALLPLLVEGSTWSLAGLGEVIHGDGDLTTKNESTVTIAAAFADPAAAEGAVAAFTEIVEQGGFDFGYSSDPADHPFRDEMAITTAMFEGATFVATLAVDGPGLPSRVAVGPGFPLLAF